MYTQARVDRGRGRKPHVKDALKRPADIIQVHEMEPKRAVSAKVLYTIPKMDGLMKQTGP